MGWLDGIFITLLVSVILHSIVSGLLFVRRREVWPISGRSFPITVLLIAAFPLEPIFVLWNEIAASGLPCGVLFLPKIASLLFMLTLSFTRAWRLWFMYHFARAKAASATGTASQVSMDPDDLFVDSVLLPVKNSEYSSASGSSGSTETRSLDWFTKRRQIVTEQNTLLVALAVFCLLIITPSITYGMDFTCDPQHSVAHLVFYGYVGCFLLFAVWTVLNLRSTDDGFGILAELKGTAFWILLIVVMFEILSSIAALSDVSPGIFTAVLAFHVGMYFVATRPVLHSYRPTIQRDSRRSASISHPGAVQSTSRNDLRVILSNPTQTKKLRKQMIREFSVENLMFYIDVFRFQSMYEIYRRKHLKTEDTNEVSGDDEKQPLGHCAVYIPSSRQESSEADSSCHAPHVSSDSQASINQSGPAQHLVNDAKKELHVVDLPRITSAVEAKCRKLSVAELEKALNRVALDVYFKFIRQAAVLEVNIPDTIRKAIRSDMKQCFPLLFELLDDQGALKKLPEDTAADVSNAKQAHGGSNSARLEPQVSNLYSPQGSKQHASVISAPERAAINRAVACTSSTVPGDVFERARANIHKLITEGPVARFKSQNTGSDSAGDFQKTGALSRVSALLCCSV